MHNRSVKKTFKSFTFFLLCRGVVGIGEASYSTVAPTIIADMFIGSERTLMLTIFYIAIPFGRFDLLSRNIFKFFSGLGYISGSRIGALTGAWQWGKLVFQLNH